MLNWIAGVSLVLSVLSFVLFALTIVGSVLHRVPDRGQLEGTETLDGVTKTTEALAKLVDSLGKAGPSVLCLTASIIFMIIARFSMPG